MPVDDVVVRRRQLDEVRPDAIVPVVKCRMWKTMNTSSSTPPHRIVRDGERGDLRLALPRSYRSGRAVGIRVS